VPPAIPALDTEGFRRKLAGLVDPLGPRTGTAGRANIKDAANRLCVVLASLDAIDTGDNRVRLWETVGKALEVADQKTSDDDIEHFVSECLTIVGAEPGVAAANDDLISLLGEMVSWPAEHRHDFLNYLRSHRYVVLTFGRQKWQQRQAENNARKVQARAAANGEATNETQPRAARRAKK